jgi:peroxiredoxin
MSADFARLPDGLPMPEDDGAARHLPGVPVPHVELASTSGATVDIAALKAARRVVYLYPKTGRPGVALPDDWDLIPGARGCTPQACSFRDHHDELAGLGADLFGVSSQSSAYQAEAVERLHLPFALLSDERLGLAAALGLPTFDVAGERLYRRLTLVLRGASVEHVFYPVFPPDTHAGEVVSWLAGHPVTSR